MVQDSASAVITSIETPTWLQNYRTRLDAGFKARLQRAEQLFRRLKPPIEIDHPVEIIAHSSTDLRAFLYRRDRRYVPVSATVNANSYRFQETILRSVSDPEDIGLVSALAMGLWSIADKPIPLEDLEGLPDDEFSIIVETLARFSEDHLPPDVQTEAMARSKGFIATFLSSVGFGERQLPRDTQIRNVAERGGNLFARFKRQTLEIVGPDLASAFLFILDPSLTPTKEHVKTMRELATDWQLDDAFDAIFLARMLRPRPEEEEFLDANLSRMLDRPRREELSHSIAAMRGKANAPRIHPRRPLPRLHRQVRLFARLRFALDNNRVNDLLETIVDIYCFDRGLIKFLDWSRIVIAVRRHRDITAESAFVTMLLNDSDVNALHPRASLGMGKGALIGDLTILLGTVPAQRHDLGRLLNSIKTLPPVAARAMAAAVLARPIVERLAAALTTKGNWLSGISENAYTSMQRMMALKTAESRKLLSPELVAKEIEAEVGQLRFDYFQNRMRGGRVRIPWPVVKKATGQLLEQTATHGFVDAISGQTAQQEAVPRLAQFLARKITDYILYDGPSSVDHALSDNLRHGIVVPRFLRAFDDALQTITRRRGLSVWEEQQLTQVFAQDADRILKYREVVADVIKAFVDGDLAVKHGGDLDRALFEEITGALSNYLQSPPRKGGRRPETLISSLAERRTRLALRDASKKLSEDIRKIIFAEMKMLRKNCRKANAASTNSFLDSLDSNLHEAFDEVRQWIGMVDHSQENPAFHIKEVVNLELLSTHLSAFGKLKVKLDATAVLPDGSVSEKFTVDGKYLELFESIVHNLLSNAFNHSGDELRTAIDIQFRIEPHQVFVRVENGVSPKKIDDVIANHRRTAALAHKRVGPEVRQDKQSGFQKIRSAFAKAFKSELKINIPPPSEKNKLFVVELTMPTATSILK